MNDERFKQIMEDLGMPNSHSLLSALKQVANEVEQEVLRKSAEEKADWPKDPDSALGHLAGLAFGNAPSLEIGHCVGIISDAIHRSRD